MDERRVRVGSFVEWIVAALCVIGLLWIVSVPIQRAIGPGVEVALAGNDLPPGVPADATIVPVMLMMDGREIRSGDLRTRVDAVLPADLADGPPHVSQGPFGDRHTRAYRVKGAKFYIVCEKTEPGGPMRISGIYLP